MPHVPYSGIYIPDSAVKFRPTDPALLRQDAKKSSKGYQIGLVERPRTEPIMFQPDHKNIPYAWDSGFRSEYTYSSRSLTNRISSLSYFQVRSGDIHNRCPPTIPATPIGHTIRYAVRMLSRKSERLIFREKLPLRRHLSDSIPKSLYL